MSAPICAQSVCRVGGEAERVRASAERGPSGRTVLMLVTNEGLNDPRVKRSIKAAGRAGLSVRLICRAPNEATAQGPPEGLEVHRVPRPPGLRLFKSMFGRTGDAGDPASRPFWIRPWELWILGGIIWFTWRAVALARRNPAGLIHANDLDTLPAAVILSRLHGAPLLYDAHELFSCQFSGASRQFRTILFGIEHWLIRYAHRVVTVNQSIAETLATWHGVPLPTVVINCPFAVVRGSAGSDGVGDSGGRVRRVIYQGVYVRDRGLEQLILSAAWYESAELYLRGYGELEPVLRALVKRERLESRVRFLPPAAPHQLVEHLVGFDIGVVPYRATTLNNRLCLPNKVFEYLQAGLAVAASTLPELERLVKETATGEVFDPEQPEDIARAINALTRDPDRLAECRARARVARDRYTWEAQGEPRLLACYRELTGSLYSGEGTDVHVRDSRAL